MPVGPFEAKLAMAAEAESAIGWPLAFLVDTLTQLGDLTGAEEALARVGAVNVEPPQRLAWAFLLEARGRLRVAQGRLPEGITDLRDGGQRWQSLNGDRSTASRWREDAALGLAALGAADEARQLAAEQLERAQATRLQRSIGTATRVAGTVAPRAQRIPLLREAVKLLRQTSARLEFARALVELGAALRREGQRVEARDHLREGLELAHRAAAAPLATNAREELLAAGGRARKPVFTGIDALTSSELRVARLAAEGHTNREIAEGLFVTQRTVETHLRHAFQKLAITRRDQLPPGLTDAQPK
jgi:DNA-binding CsgD family transcriptional regulator